MSMSRSKQAIRKDMKTRHFMDAIVNGHEYTVEGEGTGQPYEGHQDRKLRFTMAKGGPLPFSFDVLSQSFCYSQRPFTKYPEDLPDYFKQAFPEGLSWERSMHFEDGWFAKVSAHKRAAKKVLEMPKKHFFKHRLVRKTADSATYQELSENSVDNY